MEQASMNNQIQESQADLDEREARTGMYMTFKSGTEYFGLKIQYVSEIIQFQSITVVPETADYIKGLINLRGKVIPAVDIRLRFRQQPFEYDDRTCIIVLNVRSMLVGLIVEKIEEVVDIDEKNILPPPKRGRNDRAHSRYVYGIGKVGDTVKLLLDPDKLLNDDEIAMMEQTSNMSSEDE